MPIGVDLDNQFIRIVQLSPDQPAALQGAGAFEIPYSQSDKRIQKIRNLFRNHNWPSTRCCLGLSGRDLNLRFLSLPEADPGERDQVVSFEAKQFIGNAPLSDFLHTAQFFPYPSLNHPDTMYRDSPVEVEKMGEMRLSLGLQRKERFEDLEHCLNYAGFQATSSVPKALALFHCYRDLFPEMRSENGDVVSTLLCHVTDSTLDVVLVHQSMVLAMENGGGNFSVSRRESGAGNQMISPARKVAQQLSTRIFSIYESFRSEYENLPVTPDRTMISGSIPALRDVVEEGNELMDGKLDILDPTSKLDFSSLSTHIEDQFEETGPSWTIPVGLALMNDDVHGGWLKTPSTSDGTPMHFPTEKTEDRAKWFKRDLPVTAVLLFLLCSLVFRYLYENRQMAPLNVSNEKLEEQVETLEKEKEEFEKERKKGKRLQEQVRSLANLRRENSKLLELHHHISEVLPESVSVGRLEYGRSLDSCDQLFCLSGSIDHSLEVSTSLLKSHFLDPLEEKYGVQATITDVQTRKDEKKTTFIIGLTDAELDQEK